LRSLLNSGSRWNLESLEILVVEALLKGFHLAIKYTCTVCKITTMWLFVLNKNDLKLKILKKEIKKRLKIN